jgi:hypothetical protein
VVSLSEIIGGGDNFVKEMLVLAAAQIVGDTDKLLGGSSGMTSSRDCGCRTPGRVSLFIGYLNRIELAPCPQSSFSCFRLERIPLIEHASSFQ